MPTTTLSGPRKPYEDKVLKNRAGVRGQCADAENVETHLRLGHVHRLGGKGDDATMELNWVLENTDEPNYKMIAHLLIGDLHKYNELIDEAVGSYHTAVSPDPLCQVAVTALSQALTREESSRHPAPLSTLFSSAKILL
jgi:hypothetical protein